MNGYSQAPFDSISVSSPSGSIGKRDVLQFQVRGVGEILRLFPVVVACVYPVVGIHTRIIGIGVSRSPEVESFFEQASPASGRPCDLVGAPIIPFAYASEEDREVESFPADSCGDAEVETCSLVTDDTLVAGIVGGSFAAPDGFGIVIEVLIQHVSRKNFSCSFRNGDSRF